MTLKQLKDISPGMYEKVIQYTLSNINNYRTTMMTDLLSAFDWSRSDEGHQFWSNIHSGQTQPEYIKATRYSTRINIPNDKAIQFPFTVIKDGKVQYVEYLNGFWIRMKYDEHGFLTMIRKSNGFRKVFR